MATKKKTARAGSNKPRPSPTAGRTDLVSDARVKRRRRRP
jgi:hypothetical protein